jgi:sodium/proline symporter
LHFLKSVVLCCRDVKISGWLKKEGKKMRQNLILSLIPIGLFLVVTAWIGLSSAKHVRGSSDVFFLGGRRLGSWSAALSAGASDMTGWLLMSLPAMVYWNGLADAVWTALGLSLGTYFSWLFLAKRLRRYSAALDDAVTLPDFLSRRFAEKGRVKPILTLSAAFILIFFLFYAASCFVTGGRVFAQTLGLDYRLALVLCAAFVLLYTAAGGFRADAFSDIFQAALIILALLLLVATSLYKAGGPLLIIENARVIPGFSSLFWQAIPFTTSWGEQLTDTSGALLFGVRAGYRLPDILSTLSWGLGYFGMPQILVRFMAVKHTRAVPHARRIATAFCVATTAAAIAAGMIARTLLTDAAAPRSFADAENVLVALAANHFALPLVGLVLCAILSATMSSADSFLLIAASAVTKNLHQAFSRKPMREKTLLCLSRLALLFIALLAAVLAWRQDAAIGTITGFAWAGFGATFGSVMLLSLFWKRMTQKGALAGIILGGGGVFFYKLVIRRIAHGTLFDIYELLPCFFFSLLVIVVVSLLDNPPPPLVQKDFEAMQSSEE